MKDWREVDVTLAVVTTPIPPFPYDSLEQVPAGKLF